MVSEEDTDKGGWNAGLGCGSDICISIVTCEELDIPDPEGSRYCAISDFAVFDWLQEEEKCNSGKF